MSHEAQIETIVSLVLQRLQTLEAASPLAAAGSLTPSSVPCATNPTQDPSVLTLENRLVTLRDLEGRLEGIRTLQVAPRTVVTPAVSDELRRLGIDCRRSLRASDAAAGNPAARLLVLASAQGMHGLAAPLSAMGVATAFGEDSAAAGALEKHLRTPTALCLWSSVRPYAAALAAHSIKPAIVASLATIGDLPAALEQVQPNTLIVDDRQWSSAALVNLSRTWLGAKTL